MDSKGRQPSAAHVYIVDDEDTMREALVDILRSMDIACTAFESTAAFLQAVAPASPGCLILDIRMPDVNGLDFQMRLLSLGFRMPIIFMTGFGDIPMTVRAMKAGAADFLTKPFDDDEMMAAITAALARDRMRREAEAERDAVVALESKLTNRERQVMAAVVKGLMNKQIAYALGLTEITIKLHRASLMRKMHARTLPDLVRKAEMVFAASQGGIFTPEYSGGNAAQALSVDESQERI